MGSKGREGDRKEEEGPRISDLIGGSLNLFGIRIDLEELLASPERVRERLEALRARLKAEGGQETLSDEAWREGRASISGFVRTRGLLGEREFHIGTAGRSRGQGSGKKGPAPPEETLEPPVDVFDEGEEVLVVADVPGVELQDLELQVDDGVLSFATKPGARRSYRKRLPLEAAVEPGSLRATCRNGVLEVHLRKGR